MFKLLSGAAKGADTLPAKGAAVVYWMRMEDLRASDNRALALASAQARHDGVPLLALFVLSPQDYVAHDRGARRVDFTLRNLQSVRASLAAKHIPLYTTTHAPRTTLPARVLALLKQWGAARLYANIEYEVDELRRDVRLRELAEADGGGVACTFVHDRCIVPPGQVLTKDGRGYSVYSPFLRAWIPHLTPKGEDSPLACAPDPVPNSAAVRGHPVYGALFESTVPEYVEGFAMDDPEERERMRICWPAGEDAAGQVLDRFLHTMARSSQLGAVDPLKEGARVPTKNPNRDSRVGKYKDERDRLDADTTSRLSPYLAAGVISARACVRATTELTANKKIDVSRDTGVGRWNQEIAWRDFYNHVLALFPRVSMGRPFQEKMADVRWESEGGHLQAWKDGRTGVPVVDAGMRQARAMGWMHNRVRMIAAMYLTKDLMIDWRLGEKHFMETLVDGDLASNNGGWQWSASTGVDPAPYFRIFNPYTQSHKVDPTGEYIRNFVPELAKVRGEEIHQPPPGLADKLGYPRPLVDHNEARQRAIRRYKNPGAE
ncbi:DNA photolyase [Daedalea quercina L-15889]|uniref:DNA photolyase n=1 Tax=Daedalea quercina L-15889 TaxID=1314783 RepID=A0A165U2R4_9APHY|nr:DNA photolyase [Daedalea quercina L-15889]